MTRQNEEEMLGVCWERVCPRRLAPSGLLGKGEWNEGNERKETHTIVYSPRPVSEGRCRRQTNTLYV